MTLRQMRRLILGLFLCGILCFLALAALPVSPIAKRVLTGSLLLFTLLGAVLNFRFSRCDKCERVIPLTFFRKIEQCAYCNGKLQMDKRVI